ncbi:MAG: hypothetical protein C3F12_06145 [Candidatus Methylomirabilota bacterium]|nr:hypothetical protein [Candidatus Methylomirabilis sp.]NJD68850.1 hypothetical protein [candidate division NC10 bacterium]PWB47542.1 MAG: hypothetical protein C3F12_06145 [candidate division NC10 bacterium]
MFARKVCVKLRPGSSVAFSRTLQSEILPILRSQEGFCDALSFVSGERNEAIAISLWDGADSAEAYHRETYPQVLQALEGVIDGEPQIHAFAVSNSTIHKIPNLPW